MRRLLHLFRRSVELTEIGRLQGELLAERAETSRLNHCLSRAVADAHSAELALADHRRELRASHDAMVRELRNLRWENDQLKKLPTGTR